MELKDMIIRKKNKSSKIKYSIYAAIILSTIVNTFAMEAISEENQHSPSSLFMNILTEDCHSCILKKLPTSTDIFNFTSTCKSFHDLELENLEHLYSSIFIQGLKILIVKENKDIGRRLKQIKQALIFQNNIFCLTKSLDVDINQKQRGQITITSRLSADEIHGILSKLPHTYIVKLPHYVQWVHWIAHAPLFAETNENNYTPMAQNLKNLLKNGAGDDVTHLQIAWNCRLGKLSTYHPKAGLLWALFHQIHPIVDQFKYVISFVSAANNGANPKEFYNFSGRYNTDIQVNAAIQLQVRICYKKAIEAKLPTAQKEYDRIKDQIDLIPANGISSEALKKAVLPINQY